MARYGLPLANVAGGPSFTEFSGTLTFLCGEGGLAGLRGGGTFVGTTGGNTYSYKYRFTKPKDKDKDACSAYSDARHSSSGPAVGARA